MIQKIFRNALTQPLLLALLIFISGTARAQYCTPNFGVGCISFDDINTFVLTGVSGTAIVDSNTGCSTNAYDNKISKSVTMVAGNSYTGYVNSENPQPYEHMQVFIDFNNDFSFSSSESVGGVNGIGISGLPFTLTVPSGAAIGSHRMRVVLTFDSTYPGISPCPVSTANAYNYGEVHDYTAVINVGATCNAPASLSASAITSKSVIIGWPAVTGSTGYEYAVTTSATVPATGTATTGLSASVGSLIGATSYHAYVRNKCSAGVFSAWKTIAFTTAKSTSVTGTSAASAAFAEFSPNPVQNILRIALNENYLADLTISLFDITGKVLQKKSIVGEEHLFDMAGYAPGIYFLKVSDGSQTQTVKVAKQ